VRAHGAAQRRETGTLRFVEEPEVMMVMEEMEGEKKAVLFLWCVCVCMCIRLVSSRYVWRRVSCGSEPGVPKRKNNKVNSTKFLVCF
jgi:hypothetical protein